MNPLRVIITVLCFILCGRTFAQAQDIDTELSNLTERLATKIQAKDVKKVAVIDFTDLQGGSSELGKYIAEQMTVDFVMTNRVFTVLDRANLKKILSEHKLTATGLIDPDNAKKLGMFAGVDAILLGTIIPKGESISLTAKVIATETTAIVGADTQKGSIPSACRRGLSLKKGSSGVKERHQSYLEGFS
jgi:TolB-like protein